MGSSSGFGESEIATRAADLLVRAFAGAGPEATSGHEEIEFALIRLHRVTQDRRYLDLARHFIEQRGRIRGFLLHIWGQNRSVAQREESVHRRRAAYVASHAEYEERFQLPPDNVSPKPSGDIRFYLSAATGKYFPQHQPVRRQTVPVGHAVRFTYLETAIAMLYEHTGDEALLETLEAAWDHMVCRWMYVTGGIGSLPTIKGFSRDDELDPATLRAEFSPDHFGGITVLRGRTDRGEPLTFIPYFLWANRGESQMTVYVGVAE